ncbi:opsin-3 isoform X2 [Amia ocellicauda]|uniref:opsin-3 isoform X2 n=1 Tax=Amia ocellicauda TaxID=2972642 RepID=UPI0034648E6C
MRRDGSPGRDDAQPGAPPAMNPANKTGTIAGDEDLFSNGTYKVLAFTVGTIGVLGFCNNVLVLVLFYKCKRLRTPTNLFLLNISVSDLLVSVFGVNFTFLSCIKGRWVWDAATCVWDGFSNSFFGIVSIMTLTALAYERYIRVVHAKVIDFTWSWKAITYIWLYSLAWTGAPLIGWNRYTLEIHRLGCSLDWASKDPNDASFILFFFLSCFFVPVGIMAYCYGHILYTVRMMLKFSSTASMHPRPSDGSDHQDPPLREKSGQDVPADDLHLPHLLDALCRGLHVGCLWQEAGRHPDCGYNPFFLRQVQHSIQPSHLLHHEPEVPAVPYAASLCPVVETPEVPQGKANRQGGEANPTYCGVPESRQPAKEEGDLQLFIHSLHNHKQRHAIPGRVFQELCP